MKLTSALSAGAAGALMLWAAACSSSGEAVPTHAAAPAELAPEPPAQPAADGRFSADLVRIAREYEQLRRLDDASRWAPALCRQPPTQAGFSESKDGETHGQKLYSLYVKDTLSYAGFPATAPLWGADLDHLGQVIVKESWVPEPWEGDPAEIDLWSAQDSWGPSGLRPAERDGRLWRGKELEGLYVMYRLPPDTPGTDDGWVYGIVAPDRATVRAAGRIASCMDCHGTEADRLFGPVRYDGWEWR